MVKPNTKIISTDNIGKTIVESDYYGIEFISVCRRIRRYAIEGKLTVLTNKHKSNSGKNTHLFKLIEACNISVEDFIRGYLSVIQPYSLEKFQSKKTAGLGAGNVWLCDIGYKISLVIKLDETNKNKPMIISFHESNLHGNNSIGQKDFLDKKCAVIVDKVTELHTGYGVDYSVQRGFIKYNIHSSTLYFNKGVALVNYRDIKTIFDDTLNNIFERLYQTYGTSEGGIVTVDRKDTGKISFMSMGYAVVNNICLMIDLFAQYKDTRSRFIISEITSNIISEMTLLEQTELKQALEDKFDTGYKNELYISIKNTIK